MLDIWRAYESESRETMQTQLEHNLAYELLIICPDDGNLKISDLRMGSDVMSLTTFTTRWPRMRLRWN